MHIFTSSQDIDQPPASVLIARLRESGFSVDTSPQNPSAGYDPRWADWYDSGLPAALEIADWFVIVLDQGWDSSSWMAEEARCATQRHCRQQLPHVCYWNPDCIEVNAAGMKPYLRERLPDRVDEAIKRIRETAMA